MMVLIDLKFELSKLANYPVRLASLIKSKVELKIEPYSKRLWLKS